MKENRNDSNFAMTIPELMQECSIIQSLDNLEKLMLSIYDEIDVKYNNPKFEKDEKYKKEVKSYQEKVAAINKLWKRKIIMDINLNLFKGEREYHKDFQVYNFETEKLQEYSDTLSEIYEKYFYMEWIKLNYRITKTMDWEGLYFKHDETSNLCKKIDRNINKYYNQIIKHTPNAFTEQSNKEYDQPEQITVTKQFVSKLIAAVQNTNIEFDKNKFSESFGIKYDDTVRTAYNKINKQGNATVKKFINSFWMFMTDDEKEELISSYKKFLDP
jgi:hypothetical protein